MTELQDSPSWFSTGDPYSGRSGSVPVPPTSSEVVDVAETLRRRLAESQRKNEMLSSDNKRLRAENSRLKRAAVDETEWLRLMGEAADREKERAAECMKNDCQGCVTCAWNEKLESVVARLKAV